jgi:hypothetical protein
MARFLTPRITIESEVAEITQTRQRRERAVIVAFDGGLEELMCPFNAWILVLVPTTTGLRTLELLSDLGLAGQLIAQLSQLQLDNLGAPHSLVALP